MAYVEVSPKLIYFTCFAFAISIFANLFAITIDLVNPSIWSSEEIKFPITPGPVALEYLGAEADPIHSANEWEYFYPPGKGFIRLNGSYYLVSMYHQMHCVNGFRRSVEEYRAGVNLTQGRIRHLTHCLSYLRQSILCNSDISLELTSIRTTVNGETVHAAYGAGVTHECRDWREIYDYAAKNHLEWEKDDDFEVL